MINFYQLAQFVQDLAAQLLISVNVNAKNSAQIAKLMTTTEIIANMSSVAELANNRVIFRYRQNVDYTSLSRVISFTSLEETTLYSTSILPIGSQGLQTNVPLSRSAKRFGSQVLQSDASKDE